MGPAIYRQLVADGQPLPPQGHPPPPGVYQEIEDWIMAAFFDLSTCRDVGMGIGPIPITAIWEYADRAGLDVDAANTFTRNIRALDRAYLEHQAAELKKE